jgi:tetratricopeptide (TPR) repeat protein
MSQPLCFVFMPYGQKADGKGFTIDFDGIYRDLVAPAIREAGLEAIRPDEPVIGGMIHKPMLEQAILCDYAVVDLTTANANAIYELGARHGVRPNATVVIFSEASGVTLDHDTLRTLPYALTSHGLLKDVQGAKAALAFQLKEVRESAPGSSIYELVENYPGIAHTKTDVFREVVAYSPERKAQLAAARKGKNIEALRAIEAELGNIEHCDTGVVIDLLLSYRAVQAWKEVTDLVNKMSRPLASTVMVQEQLALALNRLGERRQAEETLKELIEKRGPSSESCSILGRIYKDQWEEASKRKDISVAKSLLEKAIETYLQGFEADWRDAYPGINAITLMELREPPDTRQQRLVPVVAYAVERRIATGKPDYWDYATLVELAVLAKDQQQATSSLTVALTLIRESWEPATTARNLGLIREARKQRNDEVRWADEIERKLLEHSKAL